MSKTTLALQLFSLRDLGGLLAQLSAASAAGFRSVEALESHLETPRAFKEALVSYHLDCPSAHVGIELLRRDVPRLADACHLIGIRTLFVPNAPSRHDVLVNRSWERFGSELALFADRFADHGIELGYHNKDQGFSALSGGHFGFETLFRAARGSALKWQADIGWLHKAGLDPGIWLKRYSDFLISAHVKDRAPVGRGVAQDGWADIGAGTMVWPSLWKAAVDCGARTLVVEHDNPEQPFRFAQQSFAYLRRFSIADP